MDVFFDILQNLDQLDLLLNLNQQLKKLDMRSVKIYAVSEKDNEIIVSQTKPPVDKSIIGKQIEASFVAKLNKDALDRFFFIVKIKDIRLFPLLKSRFVEAIFLDPGQKKIYRGSLRLYPRLKLNKDCPVYVKIAARNERFPVKDISEGGLCFVCPKDMLNSIRFIPHKMLNITVVFPDNSIITEAEVIRRDERDESAEMQVGLKFVNLSKYEHEKLKKILIKLKEKLS